MRICPSTWLRVVSPSTLLRAVSLSNGLSNGLSNHLGIRNWDFGFVLFALCSMLYAHASVLHPS